MLIEPNEKKNCLLSYVTFPTYWIVKDKKTLYHLEHELNGKYNKELIQKIKILSQDTNVGNRYYLIKYIIKYLDEIDYLQINNLKGIFIHYQLTQDILFVHQPNIKNEDKILHIDLSGLVKKLTLYNESSN